jgi:D-alanyl-lipoteichoic acid acyltransferase DltB (MBOAT superfamily)
LRQILWGAFKKVVVADHCAIYVNDIFYNSDVYSGNTLLIGAILFAVQIYGDFSGYSDIAIGTSKLFGINLINNFAFPYFSRDIAEFWRRWHISLSSWFKDYVYFPLGGSKGSKWLKVRNTFIIFLLSGFWHGANWTFIVWGLLNAFYFLPLLIFDVNRRNLQFEITDENFAVIRNFVKVSVTFILVSLAWIFFRSEDLSQATSIVLRIFSRSFFDIETQWLLGKISILHFSMVCILFFVEWRNRFKEHGLGAMPRKRIFRSSIYLFLVFSILFMANYHSKSEFIYFQF